MLFKLHDRIIWLAHDPKLKPMVMRMYEGRITQVRLTLSGSQFLWVDGLHNEEDFIKAEFAWPDTEECKFLLLEEQLLHVRHKEELKNLRARFQELRTKLEEEEAKK